MDGWFKFFTSLLLFKFFKRKDLLDVDVEAL